MSQEPKLSCPDCGSEMDRRAMNIEYGIDDQNIVNAVFGGVLKETQCCPNCGRTELRAA